MFLFSIVNPLYNYKYKVLYTTLPINTSILIDKGKFCKYNICGGSQMKIIEQFIKGKSVDESLCEDMLFYNDDFVVVADGVTAKDSTLFNGESGGKAAARAVCDAVSGFSGDIDVYEAVELMTKRVRALYEDGNCKYAAAAGVIIYSKHRNEIWSIGDCQCIINGERHLHEKVVDRIVSDMRALVLEIARLEGATDEELMERDIGRKFVLPVLNKQSAFANGNGRFSYGVINGRDVFKKDIIVHKVKAGDVVILASDGYPELCESLAESEEKLQLQLKNNPLCDGDYRSTKGLQKNSTSFDDRAYVRFIV